jgi:predicted lipoprotein with Yx(FWY)xxD motif
MNMKTTHRDREAGRTAMAAVVVATLAAGAVAVLPATAADAANNQVKVSAQTIGSMGKVLVANGKALYVLGGGKSCNSACLKIWPALTVASSANGATAGSGVQKSKLGVSTDSAGARQVTYNGKPVYWFVGDSVGTVKGNLTDSFGKWTAVVVAKPKGTSSGSNSGSGSSSSSGGSNAGGGGVNF